MQSQGRAGRRVGHGDFADRRTGRSQALVAGPDWTWSPMEDLYGTDNTREHSLSKIPRTTFAGRIDLVVLTVFRPTEQPSWPAMWWLA
jgi:hypothetical protein